MFHFDQSLDVTEIEFATINRIGISDSALTFEESRFTDEYSTSEIEAISEVPEALAAFISHQPTFEL